MFSGLILSIGSLMLIVILIIIYFPKKRFFLLQNKLYRYILFGSLLLVSTELLAVSSVIFDFSDFWIYMFYRLNWLCGMLLFCLYFYYVLSSAEFSEYNNLILLIKNNRTIKHSTLSFLVLIVVYFFLPFTPIDKNSISYIPGPAAYFVLIFSLYVALLFIFVILKGGKENFRKHKQFILTLFIILSVVYSFQLVFIEISVLEIGAVFSAYILYFFIENPDIKLVKELEIVNEDIERSSKTKSDFLFNMSHEIRTPMNAIVGFSETLSNYDNFDEKEIKKDIENIFVAGNNLLDIINNILDISKIESGKETIDNKEYALESILFELESIIKARIGKKPITLIMDIDKDVPSKLYGDSTKIFQILINILTNSVKYTEIGKIKLSLDCTFDGDYATLHFKVSDTGYGIKKEDFNKLFEKFSRLDEATNNEIEGTGLGLAIVKKHISLLGGKIWFESEYQVGTTFYIDIPQKVTDRRKIGDLKEIKEEKEKEKGKIDCSNYKVLLVDDNKLNLKVASRLLGAYNFDIVTVESGKECIYKIKAGEKYDMIFLDHMMPEMDGIETLHILKSLKDYEIPPVVALTANAITGMKEMYLNEGFDEYLSKPINVVELDNLLNKYFKK